MLLNDCYACDPAVSADKLLLIIFLPSSGRDRWEAERKTSKNAVVRPAAPLRPDRCHLAGVSLWGFIRALMAWRKDTSGSRPSPLSFMDQQQNNKTSPQKFPFPISHVMDGFSSVLLGLIFISSVIPTKSTCVYLLAWQWSSCPLTKFRLGIAKKDPHRGSCVSGTAA